MIQFNSLPVDGPLRITSKFGPRNTGIKGASTYHKGIDLGRDWTKTETKILAIAKGKVTSNYWNRYRGWVIVIQHDGFLTLYQHLKRRSSLAVGTPVKAAAVLGVMGNSSDRSVLSVAVHLHFELIVRGVSIDPQPYLENIQPESNHVREAMELAGEISSAVIINDKESLIAALSEAYNGSVWWVIKKLLACNYTVREPIDGKKDIYRRTLEAIPIKDTSSYNKELLTAGQNSLFWVIKKLLDKLGVE